MRRRVKFQLFVLSVLMLFVASCSQVAITGRSQLNLIPDSTMNSMSFQEYDKFLSENPLSSNAQQTAMVKRVGGRISSAVEKYAADNGLSDQLAGYQWEFNLIEDPAVNAWAMPGGKVVVYTGLLAVANGETGLAVVMGHEIAHAFAKHGSERMSQGLLVEMGGMALSEAMSSNSAQTRDLFVKSYSIGTEYGVMLPYSRLHESEADHLGLIFMAMAGYDPQEAVGFWQRMSAAGGPSPPELLSTHPSDATRIRNIQKLMPEAMQYYKGAGG